MSERIELQILSEQARKEVVAALVDNGYTVTVEKRERLHEYKHYDHFVVITATPKLPEYRNE